MSANLKHVKLLFAAGFFNFGLLLFPIIGLPYWIFEDKVGLFKIKSVI